MTNKEYIRVTAQLAVLRDARNSRVKVTSEVSVYGPQADRQSPCVIARKGEDPAPTCVNPQCPKADNCRKHIANRTDPRTPSIAIITWRDCTHYDAIDPDKYKEKEQ